MRYLKLLANGIWGGLYGATLIAALVLIVNREELAQASSPAASFVLVAGLVSVYGPLICLALATAFVFVRFFAARKLGIGWFSLKAIVWFGVAALGAVTSVYSRNLGALGSLLSPGQRGTLRSAVVIMIVCCLAALTAAVLGQLRPGEAGDPLRRLAAAILAAPVPVVLLLTLAWSPASGLDRGAAPPGALAPAGPGGSLLSAPPDLLMIGVETASMDLILPLVSAGELPTLERLLKEGASARLNSIRPCDPLVAWTVLATGAPPWRNGIRDASTYRLFGAPADLGVLPRGIGLHRLLALGFGSARGRQERAQGPATLLELLSTLGFETVSVEWPYPTGEALPPIETTRARALAPNLERLLGSTAHAGLAQHERLSKIVRQCVARDLSAKEAAEAALRRAGPPGPRAVAVRLSGLGLVSAYFLRYQMPAEFGDVAAQEQAALGGVLAEYYKFVDGLVADLISASSRPSVILVESAYGVEPAPAIGRLARRLMPGGRGRQLIEPSGSWSNGPDGVLLIHGPGVAPGSKVEEADILDGFPTTLYALGIPIERGLPGSLLRRLFERRYLETHPVVFVPAYAERRGGPSR
ncbi:MAG TPA: hypothetical protein VFG76_04130 [Candidatus Polarisedimenticolia bacterium]|nr:hypothetical protein [Candidatus Polarisedimenticolia bacterium]